MRAESSLLELCRVQPIGGEANYELGVQEFRSSGVQTNAWGGIAYLKTSQPHDLITVKKGSSGVQKSRSSDKCMGWHCLP